MITLQNVYSTSGAKDFLYELLKERSSEEDKSINISHRVLPSWGSHIEFVDSFPYRLWYLIAYTDQGTRQEWAGYVSATPRNEIGIIILKKFRRIGLAKAAIQTLMQMHPPLPEIPSVRSGDWVANVNPLNGPSIRLFTGLGFNHLQNTYQHQRETKRHD